MSIVGPRPLATWENDEILKEFGPVWNLRTRLTKPGMIGLAQLYANRNDNKERFRWDLKYIKNQSILLDLKIFITGLLKTFTGKQWI